ncbi:hypothetical protein BN7_3015 [Wickerhamomyces ciferrii]|uniref:Protein kinase domain-containing protein n=1 Tax=Wickerhamomyces ciferrii (strain ATCC 14091 / BCRC 22168 / CBS 111 / JCM 3599 / NBRC 0793 / NRRL Y-1031 F-60-10) TaxID=1206466 RepID=K0KEB3_WICCF|nr:uncharacterized protein BN7_3015 [Wickerhamomyces ciferrii]CCH43465.1 hypothetical protein BN7_3015 [Wickerhamomyces ciferrii]
MNVPQGSHEELEQRSAHEGAKRRRVTRNSNKQRDQVSGSDDIASGELDQVGQGGHNSSTNNSNLMVLKTTSIHEILHHKKCIYFQKLNERNTIPKASTPTSEKFLMNSKRFLRALSKYLKDEKFNQHFLYILNKDEKIFIKLFDFLNLARLKDHEESGYVLDPLTMLDRYRLGSIEELPIEEIDEMQGKEFSNELKILTIIQTFNFQQKDIKDRVNIPKIYCSGELKIVSSKLDNHWGKYIAMELIDNVNEKPQTEAQFRSLRTQLDNLHSSGIHHGDVHERNCCVMGNNETMLFDFGRSCLVKDLKKKSKYCLRKTCEDYKNLEDMMKKTQFVKS